MTLGEKIKLLRTEQEITQPALAEKAGIEQSYLSKLEHDKGAPSFDIINRLAMALGTTGMDLINSLSQSYIEDHLSHIPEVVAEYESLRLRNEMGQKKRFLTSSALMTIGVFLFIAGITGVFFKEGAAHYYFSEGIIRDEEPDYLFDIGGDMSRALSATETDEEFEARLIQIKNRFQQDMLVSYEYLGDAIIRDVEGGRRKYFRTGGLQDITRSENYAILSIGLALIVSGLLGLFYSLRFNPKK